MVPRQKPCSRPLDIAGGMCALGIRFLLEGIVVRRTTTLALRLGIRALLSLSLGIVVVHSLLHYWSTSEWPGVHACFLLLSDFAMVRPIMLSFGSSSWRMLCCRPLLWRIHGRLEFFLWRIHCYHVRIPVVDVLCCNGFMGLPSGGYFAIRLPWRNIPFQHHFGLDGYTLSPKIMALTLCQNGFPFSGFFVTGIYGCPCHLIGWILCGYIPCRQLWCVCFSQFVCAVGCGLGFPSLLSLFLLFVASLLFIFVFALGCVLW